MDPVPHLDGRRRRRDRGGAATLRRVPRVAYRRPRREVQPVQRLGHREPTDEPDLRQLPRPAPQRDPDRVRPGGPGALAPDVARVDRPRRGRRRPGGGLATRGRGGVRVPLHGCARVVGAQHRDAQPDDLRGPDRAGDRDPVGDLGRQTTVRRASDPAGPRCDADDPGVLLPGTGRPAVRHRRADGAHRHGDLRHPARHQAHGARRAPGPRDVARGRTLVRFDVAPTPATGPAATGEAGDPARGQPDDHDGARHRGDRGNRGGRRSGSGGARRPQQPERGLGARGRPRHRRAGDRARPDHLGVGRPRPEATRNHHGPRVRTGDLAARRDAPGAGARRRRDLHRSPGAAPTGLPVGVDGEHRGARERRAVVDPRARSAG